MVCIRHVWSILCMCDVSWVCMIYVEYVWSVLGIYERFILGRQLIIHHVYVCIRHVHIRTDTSTLTQAYIRHVSVVTIHPRRRIFTNVSKLDKFFFHKCVKTRFKNWSFTNVSKLDLKTDRNRLPTFFCKWRRYLLFVHEKIFCKWRSLCIHRKLLVSYIQYIYIHIYIHVYMYITYMYKHMCLYISHNRPCLFRKPNGKHKWKIAWAHYLQTKRCRACWFCTLLHSLACSTM